MCKVGRMYKCIAGIAAVMFGALGCGDNSRACGPGTSEDNGYCVPAPCGFGTHRDEATGQCVPDGNLVCSDGTVFDPLTGSCKIDPSSCQNGTVLIGDACVDPTSQLVIDAQEGPEPNGLGFIEPSDAQAGNITLKPVGGGPFVVHGTIDPFRDLDADGTLDPDVDTYFIAVTAPTFLRITAAGVGGTAAGFVALANVGADDALEDWERVGLSLVSNTAVREVFLPRAGSYHIAIADSRTLLEYVTTGTGEAAPGNDTSEYYVAIAQQAVPAPTALVVTNNTASVTGSLPAGGLAVYGVPLGNGLNSVTLSMPSPLATGAFVVTNNNQLAGDAIETSEPARALVGNIMAGDTTLIAIDQAYALVPAAADFTLDVSVSNAVGLSRTGGTVQAPASVTSGSDFSRLNLFGFEVSAANATVALQLQWTPAVVGQIYDATGQLAAAFTTPGSGGTWTTYRGLVRLPAAGRYYVAVHAPSATTGTTLGVVSSIAELVPAAITQGTPLTAALGFARAAPFLYAAGADPWHQFDATGVNTGGQEVAWFDPSLAFGRLDALVTSSGTLPPEATPVFTRTYAQAGGPSGRVLLDDGLQAYYVRVSATNPTTTPSVTLTFARRSAMVDLGTLTTGTVTRTGETIDPNAPQRFYLVRTGIGKTVTITVTPTSNLNTQLRRLRADETALGALINTSANGADVETFTQAGTGWTAFAVSSAGNLAGARTFDVSVSVQ